MIWVMSASRFAYERELLQKGVREIAGVDEAGRGPLAGPVVAAAVILPIEWVESGVPQPLRGLNDSKQLTAAEREKFFEVLISLSEVRYGIGQRCAEEIDRVNILQATHLAMNEAIEQIQPSYVLVDGLRVHSIRSPQTAIVKGDALSYSIAAASVIAKVTRDRAMLEYDRQFPHYGFSVHKGYGTPQHLAALAEHGPCPIHRRSFAPVRKDQLELFELK